MAFLEEGVETLCVDSSDTAGGVADRQMGIFIQLRVVTRCGVAEGNGGGGLDELVGFGAVKVSNSALSVQNVAIRLAGTAIVVLEGGFKTLTTLSTAPRLVDVLGVGSRADIDALVANIINCVVAEPPQGTIPTGVLEAVDRRRVIDIVLFVHVHADTDLLEVRCAGNGTCLFTGLGQSGKQHGG